MIIVCNDLFGMKLIFLRFSEFVWHTAENGPSGFKSKHINCSLDYVYMQATELYSQFLENATKGFLSKSIFEKL